jgi:hypothetical protein
MSRQEKRRISLALRNLWNAGTRIRSAELFLAKNDWGDAIRESREALDFVTQALLFSAGIEWNRFQKPGPLLLASKEKISLPPFGDWSRIEQILGEAAPSLDEAASFGGSDFMTFGDPFEMPATSPPTEETALASLEGARYLCSLCHEIVSLSFKDTKRHS